jgi:hypothetical protein
MIQAYSTELTWEQYELLASLLPPETDTGRPRTVNMMSVIQGILYGVICINPPKGGLVKNRV